MSAPPPDPDSPEAPGSADPASPPAFGTKAPSHWASLAVCVTSTVFYCIANLTLRELTALGVDNDWSLFWKEFLGLSLLLPWIAFRCLQGRYRLLSKRLFLWLIFGGILCELVGARLHLHAYLVVGILISAPLIQGASMSGTATFGLLFLRDPLSRWKRIAMGILFLAVVTLLVGKEMAEENRASANAVDARAVVTQTDKNMPENTVRDTVEAKPALRSVHYLLAGLGAVLAGLCYSIHMVVIRFVGHLHWYDDRYSPWESIRFRHWIGHDRQHRFDTPDGTKFYAPFPVTLIMTVIFFVGICCFGSCLFLKSGWPGFVEAPLQTAYPLRCWLFAALAGLSNLIGFFFQVQGLRMTSAAQVALVAVSQFLFLALFGMLFFGEPTNAVIWCGVGLTVCGVLLSTKTEDAPRPPVTER